MPTPNIHNHSIYEMDNLPVLRGINSETVDLIATDPPFNKGRDFHATPDSLAKGASFTDRWSWEKDIHQEWIDQIKTDWPAVWEVIDAANHTWGRDMGAFLCYMGVRLMEMHRVLKPTGAITLHCDHTAAGYLTLMLDAIFGSKNRRNEIVWCYTGPSNSPRWFPRKHDTIFYYVKTQDAPFNRDAVRVKYKKLNAQHREAGGGGIGGNLTPEARDAKQEEGKVPEDYWLEDRDGMSPVGRLKDERRGYKTQKPISLMARIIAACSNEGDLVFDPFCGCATTLLAAEKLNRRWVGADFWDRTGRVLSQRLHEEIEGSTPYVQVYEQPPVRTDDGIIAAPPLKSKKVFRQKEPGPVLPRHQMLPLLLEQQEGKCAGCGREYDDPLIWEIDHITPRSDGGVNHHSNRCLLCPPCNRIKSNTLTLSGLQRENRKRGRMAAQ